VVSHISVSLSLAVLLWLRSGDEGGDDDELVRALWEVLDAPRGVGLLSMSAQLCSLIFPYGRLSSASSSPPPPLLLLPLSPPPPPLLLL